MVVVVVVVVVLVVVVISATASVFASATATFAASSAWLTLLSNVWPRLQLKRVACSLNGRLPLTRSYDAGNLQPQACGVVHGACFPLLLSLLLLSCDPCEFNVLHRLFSRDQSLKCFRFIDDAIMAALSEGSSSNSLYLNVGNETQNPFHQVVFLGSGILNIMHLHISAFRVIDAALIATGRARCSRSSPSMPCCSIGDGV